MPGEVPPEKPQEGIGTAFSEGRGVRNSLKASDKMNDFQNFLDGARQAVGDIASYSTDGTLRHVTSKRAAVVRQLNLSTMAMPAFAQNPLRAVHSVIPTGTQAGQTTTLEHALIAGSRCAEAGARIIVSPPAEQAKIINGEPVFTRRDMRFDLIEAAPFTRTVEGVDLPLTTLPISRDAVDLDIMPLVGVHVSLTRAEMRQYEEGQLATSALASIMLGLARAADTVLLGTILYNNPQPFGLQKAAAAGLRFGELRALIGTSGIGAGVAPDGTLRAGWGASGDATGIMAEFTDVIAETIIGDFTRSAIAVHDEIQMIADRTNVKGDLTLTVFAGIQALIPRRDVFWVRGQ